MLYGRESLSVLHCGTAGIDWFQLGFPRFHYFFEAVVQSSNSKRLFTAGKKVVTMLLA